MQNHEAGAAPEVAVVVLAAGQGTRMKSSRAKVLHEICGLPMLGHIQKVAEGIAAQRLLVVVGRDADEVRRVYGESAEFVLQAERKGTGHAVMMTEDALRDFSGDVFVLYGDTPLLRVETLERMRAIKAQTAADLVMLTASGDIPGRVVRDEQGRVARIVEAQDATPEELAIEERNTGVYLFSADLLRDGLASLRPDNAQGELYITDIVGYAVARGLRVEAVETPDPDECMGINNRAELADATAYLRRRIAHHHMTEGVSFVDPESVYIDADVTIGRDTIIEPGVVITGDSHLGEGVHVKAGCVIEDSQVDDDVIMGPSAHLRPGSRLGRGVKIGNYVEVKNSTLGAGTKASHLGYIGDADVGEGVNFSCGAIIVNYDGYKKTRSTIGDGAFVGCNANLVSPVTVEPRGFVAAGSTITKDVPEDALAVARDKQRNIEGWVARKEGRAPARPAKAKPTGTDAVGAASASKPAKKKRPARKKKATPKKRASKKKAVKKKAPKKKAAKKATKKATKKRAAKKKVANKKRAKRR